MTYWSYKIRYHNAQEADVGEDEEEPNEGDHVRGQP